MNKLTVDEIIEHCKRKTARYEQLNGIETLENADISENFIKEYWEHRQVAEYLEELQQYRSIGTVEECREAVEKQNKKKPCKFKYDNGTVNYGCPICRRKFISKINGEWCAGYFNEYCEKCGQAISWEEREGEDD